MESGILGSVHHRLPTELVLVVLDHLSDDNETLCTLARTSRALQHLAEEHIYKTIELFTVRDLHDIIEAFTYRHERVRTVQTLKLQYHYNVKDLSQNIGMRNAFNVCVAHMVNLREWHIESPYDNCHWDEGEGPQQWVEGDMESFRAALEIACADGPEEAQRIQAERRIGNVVNRSVGLALLESLVIHSHGTDSDFWDLDGFECLFRHPSLRHLHISCVSLTDDLPALHSHIKKTPLTTLIFDECELSPVSLRAVLRTPTRLKHLTLGENVWNTRRSKRIQPRLTKNAGAALEALSAVAHSLESLTHLDPSWKLDIDSYKARRMSPVGDGMRNFHALKYMQCEMTSFLHQAIIMNHELAPPNLETLRLRRHWLVSVDFFDRPPEVETYLALPSLSTLELMQSSHCWLELSEADYVCDEQRLRDRHAYAYKLYKAGINLRVSIEMHRDPNIIPPYLHGEATPIEHRLYDAEDVGFRRHIVDDVEFDTNVLACTHDTDLNEISCHNELVSQLVKKGLATHDNSKAPAGEAPETDQLGYVDVNFIEGQTRRILHNLKHHFIRHRRLRRAESILDFAEDGDGDDDEFGETEVDEEYDEDFDPMEMDEDDDDLGVIFHEQNGELYIEVYGSETDDEEEEGVVDGLHGMDELD